MPRQMATGQRPSLAHHFSEMQPAVLARLNVHRHALLIEDHHPIGPQIDPVRVGITRDNRAARADITSRRRFRARSAWEISGH